mmetsp:Transcript_45286/g.135145  ORF Transcript_45286/g.135145 Transcript_45286/m.135145 type:complete len:389 (-) Transcript_45286:129-1295(-)
MAQACCRSRCSSSDAPTGCTRAAAAAPARHDRGKAGGRDRRRYHAAAAACVCLQVVRICCRSGRRRLQQRRHQGQRQRPPARVASAGSASRCRRGCEHVRRVGRRRRNGAARVWMREELRGRLPKLVDLCFECFEFECVQAVGRQVDCVLVREVVEDVVCLVCSIPALLVAKNKVNPLVQVLAHAWALERGAVHRQEARGCGAALRPVARPRRQLHVVHRLAALPDAQRQALAVAQELAAGHVELGDELLDVRCAAQHAVPRLSQRAKEAVGRVKPSVLKAQHVRRRRAQQPVHDVPWCGVVRAVQERRHRALERVRRHLAVATAELREARRVERADRLGQVPEVGGVRQVEACRHVVAEHPREHGPLCEVVERAACGEIQVQQVIKV